MIQKIHPEDENPDPEVQYVIFFNMENDSFQNM